MIIIIGVGDNVRQVIKSNKKRMEIDLMKVRIKELIKGRKIGRKERRKIDRNEGRKERRKKGRKERRKEV